MSDRGYKLRHKKIYVCGSFLCNILCALYFINKISGSADNHNTFYQRVRRTNLHLLFFSASLRAQQRILYEIEIAFEGDTLSTPSPLRTKTSFKYAATAFSLLQQASSHWIKVIKGVIHTFKFNYAADDPIQSNSSHANF